jgi:hypothetical protein
MGRAIAIVTCTALAAAAHADFGIVDQFPIQTSNNQAFSLAFDGTNWNVTTITSARWDVFDQDFNRLSTTIASAGSQFRALGFSERRETIFAVDYPSGTVYEFNLDGTRVGSFSGPARNQVNAIGVDRFDDTVWLVTFAGGVYHYEPTGALLGSFTVPFNVSGLAIDEAAGTLLLMESSNDFVHEYDFDGNFVGVPIGQDVVPGNGLGLFYDAYSATLCATTQSGPPQVTVFQDPDRPTLQDTCFADCDESGAIDELDFICYFNAWRGHKVEADNNGDGVCDILDLVTFLDAYRSGCQETVQDVQQGNHLALALGHYYSNRRHHRRGQ